MEIRKRWHLPLRLAIVLALVYGSIEALPTINGNDYFGHHLFYTGFRSLAGRIDWLILILSFTLYLFWLGYKIMGSIKGTVERWVALAIVEPAILLGCIWLSNCKRYFFNDDTTFGSGVGQILIRIQDSLGGAFARNIFKTMISEDLPQLILVLLLILAGMGVLIVLHLRSKRRNRPVEQVQPTTTTPFRTEAIEPLFRLFTMPFIIAVIGVNLVFGAFWVRNAVLLHSRPNVVVIMFDTVRADHMGFNGYPRNVTPNLDALARDGLRFQHAVSQAPWTTWSVASMMTSRYPESMRLGVWNNPGAVDINKVMLAEALSEYGYSTSAVVSNFNVGKGLNFDQGFNYFDDSLSRRDEYATGVLKESLKRIDQAKGKRFFLFSLFMDPHTPYRQHKGFDFDPEYQGKVADVFTPVLGDYYAHRYTDVDVRHMAALYDSEIAYADKYAGKLLDELKKRNLYDNTLIVFFADHGEEFTEHGGFTHIDTLYPELIDVPLVIKLPRQERGTVVKGIFPMIDLFPSMMHTLKLDVSSCGLLGEGVNLQNIRTCRSRPIYSATNVGKLALRCVVLGHNKYILDLHSGREELYNDETDPSEKHNIAAAEPAVTKRMRDLLLRHQDEVMNSRMYDESQTSNSLSASDKERLRSLGYAQ